MTYLTKSKDCSFLNILITYHFTGCYPNKKQVNLKAQVTVCFNLGPHKTVFVFGFPRLNTLERVK